MKQKEKDVENYREKATKQIGELLSENKNIKSQYQQMSISLSNSQRQVTEKDFQLSSQSAAMRNLSQDLEDLKAQHNQELQNLEQDMKVKYDEIKALYHSKVPADKNNRDHHDHDLSPSIDAYLTKIKQLEGRRSEQ